MRNDPMVIGNTRPPGRIGTRLRAVVIASAVFAVYWPAIHGTWLWDDGYEVAENPTLRDPGGLLKIWRGEGALDYFPLKATAQWLLWRVLGDQPAGWHVTNIGLHLVSALLVARILQRLGVSFFWFGGLVFALHPLAVESVAWIAEFKNVLSLPVTLLAFLAYLDYDERQRARDLGRAVLLFVAALLCKSTIVMLPCVLGVYLWWKYGGITRRQALSLAPFFAVALVLGLVTVWFQHTRAIGGVEVPVGGWATRVARAGLAIWFYAWKAVWPVDLMPVYPRWAVTPPSMWQFIAWPLLGVVLAVVWSRRATWGRSALLGVAAFGCALAPILGFLAMAYMHAGWVADHFAYAALPAVAGLAAGGLGLAVRISTESIRWLVFVAATLMAGLLLILARSYAEYFRSGLALWTYAVRQNPASAAARNNLGNALLADGRTAEALAHFGVAVRLEPRDPGFRVNLGNALARSGNLAAALQEHAAAVAAGPFSVVAANSLGGSLLDADRLPEARRQFERALELDPRSAEAHSNLGVVLAREGAFATAKTHFETALRLNPDLSAARTNLERLERNEASR